MFFMLRPKSDAVFLEIQREAAEYGDVIVTSGIFEDYHNTTHSVVSIMKAAAALGPQSIDHVLKTDDDVYFRIPQLLQHLVTRPKRGLYAGFPMVRYRTPRGGRHWLSHEAWPYAWTERFAWGAGCVLSIDLVQYMAAGKSWCKGLILEHLLIFYIKGDQPCTSTLYVFHDAATQSPHFNRNPRNGRHNGGAC
jgi:hypothetical protein